jgi:anti-sigma factor RsiW
MRARGTSGANPPERELWRRSQGIEAPFDEAEYLSDLAAFADNRLDDDDTARIAALIARDPTAAEDVAAARALAAVEMAADERVVTRATALIDGARPEALVLAFAPPPPVARRPLYSAATWSSLAAAIAFAGWLGFNLGDGLSSTSPVARSGADLSTSEALDPPLLLRDFTENTQI